MYSVRPRGGQRASRARDGLAHSDASDWVYAEMMHLQLRKKDLTTEADGLKDAIKQSAEKAAEKRDTEEKQHSDDIERIVRTNEQLKTSLENLLAAPSKK